MRIWTLQGRNPNGLTLLAGMQQYLIQQRRIRHRIRGFNFPPRHIILCLTRRGWEGTQRVQPHPGHFAYTRLSLQTSINKESPYPFQGSTQYSHLTDATWNT